MTASQGDPQAMARRLAEVRKRTLELMAPVDEPTRRRQHIPILSPMVWDLGHMACFEDTWIRGRLAGKPLLEPELAQLFDPAANPRPTRATLPVPNGEALSDYMRRVREETLRVLGEQDFAGGPELARDGYVFELVAEHEEQHQETLLQLLQMLEEPPYRPAARRELPAGRQAAPEWVTVAEGSCTLGTSGNGFAYDNERPAHDRELAAFRIGRFPVTNGEYLEFVAAGGYARAEWWSEVGWRWREESGAEAPGNWSRQNGSWQARYADSVVPLPLDRLVVHVSFFEAEAYTRWAGVRLPTEAEWEKAALWDPRAQWARRFPWGDDPPDAACANLDHIGFAPAPIGAYPAGASAYGCEQLVGDVWEWTASDFLAYPGFEAHPYPEYSEVFFGHEYKVLRGGSWATRPAVARGTFRNWDFPQRRQIFAGFRCAADP
ncbi:MAG: ergothioneine biosynthesis protein EgtB, partial [Thermoanaerobaculia bacterium]